MSDTLTDAPTKPWPADEEAQHVKLLEAASDEFARLGLKGARMEHIARQAGVTRAMIYYFFGGREGLYLGTLEAAYRTIRRAELALDLEGLGPMEALRRLVEFRIDFYVEHPNVVALVSIENQHGAAFLDRSPAIRDGGRHVLERMSNILASGQAQGLFRADVNALDVHQLMVSLGFFNVSNRHTFGRIFGKDLCDPEQVAHTRQLAVDVVLRYVAASAATR